MIQINHRTPLSDPSRTLRRHLWTAVLLLSAGVAVSFAILRIGPALSIGTHVAASTANEDRGTVPFADSLQRVLESTAQEAIAHGTTEEVGDSSQRIGYRLVLKKGTDGLRLVTYDETFVDGLLRDQSVAFMKILRNPVSAIVRVGTSKSVALGPRSTWVPVVSRRYQEIAPLLNVNGSYNYLEFKDNGNGTITVDGRTFSVVSEAKHSITAYDAAEWYVTSRGGIAKFPPGTPIVEGPSFSGLPARRGIVATYAFKENGAWVATRLPMGTVLFIEDYGLAVVGDIHHVTSDIDRIDCSYNPREVLDLYRLGVTHRRVYVLDWP